MSGTKSYQRRLALEYKAIKKNPAPFISAEPLPQNILEWHYVISGLEEDPYKGGVYHGKLVFPKEYPMKPPAIYMITPNGRFKENTRLCLSMSDFHPDTWNPAWSVESILKGLLSFMLESTPTSGSIQTSAQEKRRLAKLSLLHNLKNDIFCELFPEEASRCRAILREKRELLKKRDSQEAPSPAHPSQTQKGEGPEVSTPLMLMIAAVVVPVAALLAYAVLSSAP